MAHRRALAAVRISVALLIAVHGVARASLGIVDDFGLFLANVGFPFGHAVAWGVTAFEVVAGGALAMGRGVRPVSVLLSLELLVGIALVHWSEGWFVVGAGRNGMEYSVLLIVCLLALAHADGPDEQAPGAGSEPHANPL